MLYEDCGGDDGVGRELDVECVVREESVSVSE